MKSKSKNTSDLLLEYKNLEAMTQVKLFELIEECKNQIKVMDYQEDIQKNLPDYIRNLLARVKSATVNVAVQKSANINQVNIGVLKNGDIEDKK